MNQKQNLNLDITIKDDIQDIDKFLEATHIFVMSTGNPNEGSGSWDYTSGFEEKFNN